MKHKRLTIALILIIAAMLLSGYTVGGHAPTLPPQCEPGSAGCVKIDNPVNVSVYCREIGGIMTDCVTVAYPAPGE